MTKLQHVHRSQPRKPVDWSELVVSASKKMRIAANIVAKVREPRAKVPPQGIRNNEMFATGALLALEHMIEEKLGGSLDAQEADALSRAEKTLEKAADRLDRSLRAANEARLPKDAIVLSKLYRVTSMVDLREELEQQANESGRAHAMALPFGYLVARRGKKATIEASLPRGRVSLVETSDALGAGSMVNAVAEHLSTLAQRTKRSYAYDFNGTYLIARPGQDGPTIQKGWSAATDDLPLAGDLRHLLYTIERRLEEEKAKTELEGAAARPARPIESILRELRADNPNNWVIAGLDSLRHPDEIRAFVRHVVMTAPEIVRKLDLKGAVERMSRNMTFWIRERGGGAAMTEPLWEEAFRQMPGVEDVARKRGFEAKASTIASLIRQLFKHAQTELPIDPSLGIDVVRAIDARDKDGLIRAIKRLGDVSLEGASATMAAGIKKTSELLSAKVIQKLERGKEVPWAELDATLFSSIDPSSSEAREKARDDKLTNAILSALAKGKDDPVSALVTAAKAGLAWADTEGASMAMASFASARVLGQALGFKGPLHVINGENLLVPQNHPMFELEDVQRDVERWKASAKALEAPKTPETFEELFARLQGHRDPKDYEGVGTAMANAAILAFQFVAEKLGVRPDWERDRDTLSRAGHAFFREINERGTKVPYAVIDGGLSPDEIGLAAERAIAKLSIEVAPLAKAYINGDAPFPPGYAHAPEAFHRQWRDLVENAQRESAARVEKSAARVEEHKRGTFIGEQLRSAITDFESIYDRRILPQRVRALEQVILARDAKSLADEVARLAQKAPTTDEGNRMRRRLMDVIEAAWELGPSPDWDQMAWAMGMLPSRKLARRESQRASSFVLEHILRNPNLDDEAKDFMVKQVREGYGPWTRARCLEAKQEGRTIALSFEGENEYRFGIPNQAERPTLAE